MESDNEIIFDLDNTLIYASFKIDDIEKLGLNKRENKALRKRCRLITLVDSSDDTPKGTGKVQKIIVVLRPHVQEFLEFSIKYFAKISIWSAGQERYVRTIERILFPERIVRKNKTVPHRIFSFADCVVEEDGTTYKEIIRKDFNPVKTFCLDDRDDTFSKNFGNGIHIPAYSPKITKKGIMKEETSLLELMEWLKKDEVRCVEDVRTLDKSKIFSREPE